MQLGPRALCTPAGKVEARGSWFWSPGPSSTPPGKLCNTHIPDPRLVSLARQSLVLPHLCSVQSEPCELRSPEASGSTGRLVFPCGVHVLWLAPRVPLLRLPTWAPSFSAAPVLCNSTVPGGADGSPTGVSQPHKQELTDREAQAGGIVPDTARGWGCLAAPLDASWQEK